MREYTALPPVAITVFSLSFTEELGRAAAVQEGVGESVGGFAKARETKYI